MPSTSTAHEVDRNVSAAADVKPKSRWRSRKQVSIDMSAKFFYRRLPMHYSSFFNTKLYGSILTGTSVEGRVSRGLSATAELLNIVCVGRHCSEGEEGTDAFDVDCTRR